MKIIHTGDLHLGFPLYKEEVNFDYFKSFAFAVDYALENRADLFVVAGDLFDKRDPQTAIQRGFAREINRLVKRGIPAFIVTGNHEGSPNPDRNIHLDVYRELEIEGVTIAKKISLFTISKINIISVPYPFKRNLMPKEEYRDKSEEEISRVMNEKIIQAIDEACLKITNDLPTIVVAHLPVLEGHIGEEAYANFALDMPMSIEELDREFFSYIALGHFHQKQVMSSKRFAHPFVYSGSIDRLSFGEEEVDKGFFDIDVNDKDHKASFHFIKNPYARDFYTISVGRDEDLNAIDEEAVKRSITRVVLHSDVGNEQLFKETVERVKQESYIFASFEDRRAASLGPLRSIFSTAITPKEAIEKYLSARSDNYTQEHRHEILQTAVRLIETVTGQEEDSKK